MAAGATDLALAMSLQMSEIESGAGSNEDYMAAYRLQLEEAMKASVAHVPCGSAGPQVMVDLTEADLRAEAEARELLMECKAGAVGGQQVLADREIAHKVFIDEAKAAAAVKHDAKFAREIDEADEYYWEAHGDNMEAESSPPRSVAVRLRFDGSSLGNPGQAGWGAILLSPAGETLWEQAGELGVATNNEAEYQALIHGLRAAVDLGLPQVEAEGDSELVIKQMKGSYRASDPRMRALRDEALEVCKGLPFGLTLRHIRRERNRRADRLAQGAARGNLAAGHRKRQRDEDMEVVVVPDDDEVEAAVERCEVCLEDLPAQSMHAVDGCFHRHCVSCLEQVVLNCASAKRFPVDCPSFGCDGALSMDECRVVLSRQHAHEIATLERLETLHSIPDAAKFYCPFSDCSSLMILEQAGPDTPVQCHECSRTMCAWCRCQYHDGLTCGQFQALPMDQRSPEDQQLLHLARESKWRQCQKCKAMIELNTGCNHITCLCSHEFCYVCGEEFSDGVATCRCDLWDEANIIDDEQGGQQQQPPGGQRRQQGRGRYYKTRLCRFWTQGNCRHGNRCNFAHGEGDLR